MLRTLIYFFKRLVHKNLPVYQLLYSLVTLNLNYLKQKLAIAQYPSRFGGMWTDRKDYPRQLQARQRAGKVDPASEDLLAQWREQGFIILKGAIAPALIDQYLDELAALKSAQPMRLKVTAATLAEPALYSADLLESESSVRTVDDYFFSPASREILLSPAIMQFVEQVFDARPLLNQSLSFQQGSQQAIHQDTVFVRMNAPMQLAASWVALEDVTPGSGELVYYPGSHRWEGFLFSGRFKHYDEERDGLDQLQQWYQWLDEEARRRGCEKVAFLPSKGDVLIWHGALAHGGAAVTRTGSSRLSLVGHYCPRNVRPLYHYYKPAQRQCYPFGDYSFCTSYYP